MMNPRMKDMTKKLAIRLHSGDEVILKRLKKVMKVVSDACMVGDLVVVDLVDEDGRLHKSVMHTEIS